MNKYYDFPVDQTNINKAVYPSHFVLLRSRLDKVGPIDNRPSTGKLQHFGGKNHLKISVPQVLRFEIDIVLKIMN